jgi:O-antigen/teichoic acid export membrane protein
VQVDAPVTPPRQKLSTQAVQSTFWAYISFLSGKALVFVSTIILARLLVPEQFGMMGYCLIAIQYLDALNGLGVDAAVISRRDKVAEAANAAFVISLISGVVMFAVAWLTAPRIAVFFDEPEVTQLFRVIAIVLPFSAVGSVPMAMLQRALRFKAKFIPDVGRSIAKGGISIVLAWQGFGVWSLVYGQIAGEIIATIAVVVVARWRPTRVFDRQVTREVLRFGIHIILVGITGALVINVDYLLVGRILGAAALGYYTLAYRIPELVIRNTNFVIGKVAFPLLAQVQSDDSDLRRVYGALLRYVSLFTIPAGVGMALIAPLFIDTFYTGKWEPAVAVMQLIAISLAISSIGHLPGIIYKSINRPEILNQLSFAKLIVTVGVLWFSVRWGINGVAFGQVALSVMFVMVDTVVVARLLKYPPEAMVRAIGPALICALTMAAVVVGLVQAFSPSGATGLFSIVTLAVIVYGLTLLVVSRETVLRARNIVQSALVKA